MNRTVVIGVIVALIIIVIGIFFLRNRASAPTPAAVGDSTQTDTSGTASTTVNGSVNVNGSTGANIPTGFDQKG